MVENLKRIREPLAWALIVVVAFNLVVSVIRYVWYLLQNTYDVGVDGERTVTSISWSFGLWGVDLVPVIALVVAAVACAWAPAVPRWRAIALAASWLATLTVLLPWLFDGFVALVWPEAVSMWAADLEWLLAATFYQLPNTGVGLVGAVALWTLARRPRVEIEDEEQPQDEAVDAESTAPEAEHPTIWKPTEATGTAWRTADEAAAGAPGAPSLGQTKGATSASEWALEVPEPRPQPSDDWRPPATH